VFFTLHKDFSPFPQSEISLLVQKIQTTMCSARKMISGPATEALEQQASKKMRLSYQPVEVNPASNALSFEFDVMFNAVASFDSEAFPSIAWDLDDDDDDDANHAQVQIFEQTRVHGSGMLRSKSLKRDLSSLDVNSLNTRVSLASIASIDKIPLSSFNLGCNSRAASESLRSTLLSHRGTSFRSLNSSLV
jgi:hypothetical protein